MFIMKKTLLLIAILIPLAFSGCGSEQSATPVEVTTETTTEVTTEETTTETITTENKVSATIEEQKLYNGNGVKIKATSLVDDTLYFEFENTSKKDISASIRAYAINNIMIDSSWDEMETTLPSGSEAKNSLKLETKIPSKIYEHEFTPIKNVKLQFWFWDSEGNEIDTTDVITIKTDCYDLGKDKIKNKKIIESNGTVFGSIDNPFNPTFLIKNKNKTWYSYTLNSLVVDGKAYQGDLDSLDILERVVFPNCVLPIQIEADVDSLGTFCMREGIVISEADFTLGIDAIRHTDYDSSQVIKFTLK